MSQPRILSEPLYKNAAQSGIAECSGDAAETELLYKNVT